MIQEVQSKRKLLEEKALNAIENIMFFSHFMTKIPLISTEKIS